MEKRLIDANNAISVLKILSDKCGDDNVFEQAISVLESAPTIDAVPVVRCKECHWGHLCVFGQHLGLDGFCSKGERKEKDDGK